MKYYSDVTEKVYQTEKELLEAEEAVKKAQEEKGKKAALVSKQKKEMASAIEDAEKELVLAYKELDTAREKAKQLQKETLKRMEEILHPAEEKVKLAQERKLDAIRDFNSKFGAFTTTLTGAKAAEEMSRVWRVFDSVFNFFL